MPLGCPTSAKDTDGRELPMSAFQTLTLLMIS